MIEGWFSSGILGSWIARMIKNNTPTSQHTTTLIGQGRNLEHFRDSLRIHNVMCGYIFLLDGIGRIRFAASGEASSEEIQKLIQFASELITTTTPHHHHHNQQQHHQGRRTATDSSSHHHGGGVKSKRKAKKRSTQ